MARRLKTWVHAVTPLLPVFVGGLSAELLVRFDVVPSYLLPAPSAVLKTMIEDRVELGLAMWSTFWCASLALILSFVLGASVAIACSLSDFWRRAFYPYAVFFQTVPVISIAPLLVIWFGFGEPTVIASAFFVSIFPIIASTMLGLTSTDRNLIDLFRLYGASRQRQVWWLRLPFALPHMLSGLRIAAGLAVIGAIVGEFIGGGGLGSVIDSARTQLRVDKVFAAVLLSSLLGLALVALINQIAKHLLGSWHASEQ